MKTKITEKDLIRLGFKRADADDIPPFYYYTYDFFKNPSGLCLITDSNDEVKKYWKVYVFNEDRVVIKDLKLLKQFIKIVEKIKK